MTYHFSTFCVDLKFIDGTVIKLENCISIENCISFEQKEEEGILNYSIRIYFSKDDISTEAKDKLLEMFKVELEYYTVSEMVYDEASSMYVKRVKETIQASKYKLTKMYDIEAAKENPVKYILLEKKVSTKD